MKLKLLLPWLCVVGLVIGLAAVYSDSQKQAGDLAKAHQDSQELEQLRAAAEEAKKIPTESEELARLRKENEEVLSLRNEVRQLRLDKAQLTRQVQVAQSQAQNAQAQSQNVQALLQTQAQRLVAAQATAASASEQQAAAARVVLNQTATCINNLRQIDGAKQQWALENKKAAEDMPSATDLAPYFKGNALPVCAAGGAYTLNAVGLEATCSIPGHVLPK
jgi:seryl-tRNA synthetase